jgi:hypothetical protein
MFDDLEDIKEFLMSHDEELDMYEAWEIAKNQQELDLFLVAYHYC